jgi:hypothetical protein
MVAGAATAAVPDATASWATRSKDCLVLVGDNGTVAASPVNGAIASKWSIQILNAVSNPIPFAVVRIDLSDVNLSSLHVATTNSQKCNPGAGVPAGSEFVDATLKSVTVTADGSGIANFIVEGAADANLYTNQTVPGFKAAVYAGSGSGILMGNLTVSALNRNVLIPAGGTASNPVNSADASVVLNMLVPVTQPYKSTADLDCNGSFSSADASIILQHLVFSNPPNGASNVCPPDGIPANTVSGLGYAW